MDVSKSNCGNTKKPKSFIKPKKWVSSQSIELCHFLFSFYRIIYQVIIFFLKNPKNEKLFMQSVSFYQVNIHCKKHVVEKPRNPDKFQKFFLKKRSGFCSGFWVYCIFFGFCVWNFYRLFFPLAFRKSQTKNASVFIKYFFDLKLFKSFFT